MTRTLFNFCSEKHLRCRHVKAVLSSTVATFSIVYLGCYQHGLSSWSVSNNPFHFFATLAIMVVCITMNRYSFRRELQSTFSSKITALALAVLTQVGLCVATYGTVSPLIDGLWPIAKTVLITLGLFIFFNLTLLVFYHNISLFVEKFQEFSPLDRLSNVKTFFLAFIALALLWLPYFIVFYPGAVSWDGATQIEMFEGILPFTTHHPPFITLYFGSMLRAGMFLSGTWESSIAFLVAANSMIEIACYAYTCVVIKRIAPFPFFVGSIFFFGLYPCFGNYAVAVLKDSLHIAFFCLMIALMYDMVLAGEDHERRDSVSSRHNLTIPKSLLFLIACVLVSLSRNNGVFLVLACFFALLLLAPSRKQRFVVLGQTFATISCILALTLSINSIFGVGHSSIAEAFSIPLQQTARYVTLCSSEVTEAERQSISAVVDFDNLAQDYNPEISDPVKDKFNKSATNEELLGYFTHWGQMFIKHPLVYIDATVNNNYDYWYPFHHFTGKPIFWTFIATGLNTVPGYEGAGFHNPSLAAYFSASLERLASFPLISLLFRPGTYTWLMIVLAGYVASSPNKTERRLLALFLPVLFVLLVCIASPVNGYFRYAMPLIAVTPLYISLISYCKSSVSPASTQSSTPLTLITHNGIF